MIENYWHADCYIKVLKCDLASGCNTRHTKGAKMATSSQLVCLEDFRSQALKLLSSEVADYLESGSGYEHTLRENRQAYNRWVWLDSWLESIRLAESGEFEADVSSTDKGLSRYLDFWSTV